MTTVTFHSAHSRLDGFVVEGHSGYAEEGSDIVCAAVSAAVGLTECTINEVMGVGALNDPSDDLCQTVMTGMLVYLQAMAEEYPENLIVLLDDDDEA